MTSFLTLGLMSGTSMDGLDIALTEFVENNHSWDFKLHHCKTYSYSDSWVKKLSESRFMTGENLMLLDLELGKLFADHVNNFLLELGIDRTKVDFIASHGHTVFHQPERSFTLQVGCGEAIAYHTGIPVINDFRTKNVLAGGQGAPLVPIGDKYLFSNFDACINIGGFSNISIMKENEDIIAFDICPGNLPLNELSQKLGHPFDRDGQIARTGHINLELLSQLNQLEYYKRSFPKSLGTEWLNQYFSPMVSVDLGAEDKITTVTEHIADQISSVLNSFDIRKALITGGGAKNSFLIERIQTKTRADIHLPNVNIIDFKEALIFGFLGCLHQLKRPNTLASVTGSDKDVTGGSYHLP